MYTQRNVVKHKTFQTVVWWAFSALCEYAVKHGFTVSITAISTKMNRFGIAGVIRSSGLFVCGNRNRTVHLLRSKRDKKCERLQSLPSPPKRKSCCKSNSQFAAACFYFRLSVIIWRISNAFFIKATYRFVKHTAPQLFKQRCVAEIFNNRWAYGIVRLYERSSAF